MTTTQTTKTPGYNHRLAIWFDTNRKGEQVAYYWGFGRSFRIGLAAAKQFIANGDADQISGHPLR